MAEIILRSKLFAPATRPSLVPRTRLIEKLNKGLAGKLTLVSAPAGFGKSTLVLDWLGQVKRPTAWLSLDENDDDPLRFFMYLVAAVQTLEQSLASELMNGLRSAEIPPSAIVPALLNELLDNKTPSFLVLDDYHVIENDEIHGGVAQLIDYLPPTVHLIITSRDEPPLPLPRWRVRGQMNEITLGDLRFDSAETSQFLRETMGVELSEPAVSILEERTEGWAAGLQLAALSLRNNPNEAGNLDDFVGSNRQVADYLIQEVLAQQSPDIQQFLLTTAILNRFNAPLCDALLGATNSQTVLEKLEQSNLFIIPLDGVRNWYRYHHLFADLLRDRLKQNATADTIQAHHRQAATWYADHDFLDDAMAHLLEIEDFDGIAAQFSELTIGRMLDEGLVMSVSRWVSQLPESVVKKHPYVGVLMMIASALTGNYNVAFNTLNLIQGDETTLPYQYFMQSIFTRNFEQDLPKAMDFLDRLLAFEGDIDHWIKANTWLQKGMIYFMMGQYEAVDEALTEVRQISGQGISNINLEAVQLQAEALTAQGDLQRAEALCLTTVESRSQSVSIGYVYNVLAGIYLTTNQLEKSEKYAQQAFDLANKTGNLDVFLRSAETLARLAYTRKDRDALRAILDLLETRIEQMDGFLSLDDLHEYAVRFWFWMGDLDQASQWAETAGLSYSDQPDLRTFDRYHTFIAIRIHQALAASPQPLPDLLVLTKNLEASAIAAHQTEGLLKSLILKSLLFDLIQDPQALPTLQQAIALAAPSKMRHPFLIWGKPLHKLLTQLDNADSPFLQELISLAPAPKRTPKADILELTARERDVLRLIADGLSNKEIEETLFISKNTVRTHIKNLYSKLHTTSRTQAIKRAHELNLL